jgi:hypothetical protein
LLIVLGVVIVGIAIAVGISLFIGHGIEANKDAIISDINNLANNAYQYRIHPTSMGGGGYSYVGANGSAYAIPSQLKSNENGIYSVNVSAQQVIVSAISAQDPSNTITVTIDSNGRPTGIWSYTGDFL